MREPDISAAPAVTGVPRRLRQACTVAAALVLAVLAVGAVLLKQTSTGVVRFHTSDQVAMIVLGLILAAGFLALGRPRVDADARGIRVRNLVGSYEFGWDFVQSVRFDRDSYWASLRLANGDEVAVLAVQAIDKERAVQTVEGLRALLAAGHGPVVPEPPRLYYD